MVVACLHVGSSSLEWLSDIHVKGDTAVGVHAQQLQGRPFEAALVPDIRQCILAVRAMVSVLAEIS